MIVLWVICGVWLGNVWLLFPQISLFYQQTPAELLVGPAGMGC
jgi:hypothetical protein